MPKPDLLIYREADGNVPLLEWLDAISNKARLKCLVSMERLEELGHELRRPEADILREGIYELRVGLNHVNYRMLHFFHGKNVVVLSHGLTKQKRVPPKEIDRAVERRKLFEQDPVKHTYREEL